MTREQAAALTAQNLRVIFAFALSRVSHRQDAEDLAGEIVVQILESAHRLKNDDAFFGFVRAIEANTYKKYLTRRDLRHRGAGGRDGPHRRGSGGRPHRPGGDRRPAAGAVHSLPGASGMYGGLLHGGTVLHRNRPPPWDLRRDGEILSVQNTKNTERRNEYGTGIRRKELQSCPL